MNKEMFKIFLLTLSISMAFVLNLHGQIPMKRVLSRITIPSVSFTRGLVDTVGFPHRARQMDFIGRLCEDIEKRSIADNQKRFNLSDDTPFIFGISPHDDYMLAARIYVHVQRYIKAKTVILIGNAHWSETFGIRNKLIFGDFKQWRGPYGSVKISEIRDEITAKLNPQDYTVNRTVVETEHSLEAQVPFLQYYNRNVEIIPILVPFMDWENMNKLSKELAEVITEIIKKKNWVLGHDIAVLCTTDGQHYGDYGWSYYDYHPFGCNADGYKKATELDKKLINSYLVGEAKLEKVHKLFTELVDQNNISNYKITWCGRFSVSFSTSFVIRLAKKAENKTLKGYFLQYGSSLSNPWLPLKKYNLGITGDVNLHHFVTYFALGFK